MSRSKATILGGGLCGALLAIMLARRGMKVTLLERQPDYFEQLLAYHVGGLLKGVLGGGSE